MTTERVQRRIERLLDQIEEGMERLDWESVRSSAQAVLALDPGNADALSFLGAAEQAMEGPTPQKRGIKPVIKWVGISVLVVWAVIAVSAIVVPLFSRFGDSGEDPASERIAIQNPINAMMADNNFTQVKGNMRSPVRIRGGTQFHDYFDLDTYKVQSVTQYCYLWQSDGQIRFQYDLGPDGNCHPNAKQLFP